MYSYLFVMEAWMSSTKTIQRNETTKSNNKLNPQEELLQTVAEELGSTPEEKENILSEFKKYLSMNNKDAYLVTHNGGSADCWANAAEHDLLQNNRNLLAKKLTELIKDGFIKTEDFKNTDPIPDGTETIVGKKLGERKGVSLVFDLAVERKFNAPFGANDFQVEDFERWIRGQDVSIVYNGKSLDNKNGKSSIDKVLESKNGQYASGVRFSLAWDAQNNSQHMYHVVTVDRIEKDANGIARVYFYQALNLVHKGGPNRTLDNSDRNFESMSLEEFKKAVRVGWIPSDTMRILNIDRTVDPAYFTSDASLATTNAQIEQTWRMGGNDIYIMATAELLRDTEEFINKLKKIEKESSVNSNNDVTSKN